MKKWFSILVFLTIQLPNTLSQEIPLSSVLDSIYCPLLEGGESMTFYYFPSKVEFKKKSDCSIEYTEIRGSIERMGIEGETINTFTIHMIDEFKYSLVCSVYSRKKKSKKYENTTDGVFEIILDKNDRNRIDEVIVIWM